MRPYLWCQYGPVWVEFWYVLTGIISGASIQSRFCKIKWLGICLPHKDTLINVAIHEILNLDLSLNSEAPAPVMVRQNACGND